MARTKQTVTAKTTHSATASKKMAEVKRSVATKVPAKISTNPVVEPAILKKKRKTRPGTKAAREVNKLQRTTNLLLQKAPFRRIVREIVEEHRHTSGDKPLLIQQSAMEALQVAAEQALTSLLIKTRRFATHAGRKTIMPADLALAVKELGLGKTSYVE